MITVIIIIVAVLVLRHEAKKHPAFAKWARRGKILMIVIILLLLLLKGNGEWVIAVIELVAGALLIALLSSFFH